jgi:hypothetical protein
MRFPAGAFLPCLVRFAIRWLMASDGIWRLKKSDFVSYPPDSSASSDVCAEPLSRPSPASDRFAMR